MRFNEQSSISVKQYQFWTTKDHNNTISSLQIFCNSIKQTQFETNWNTKPHTFSPNSSISSNFKQFQGLLVLLHFKLLQTEIKSKSMFVSIRHPTPETRWMGSTGGGTFFYTFSKKISNRDQNLVKKRVPEPPYAMA